VADLLIRDLSSTTHGELKRRAEQAGMSLQAYVTELLDRSTSMPSLGDWLDGLDEVARHPDVSGADVVQDVRDELP